VNYRHLQYFWAVARLGGVIRASEQLHVTPQTVSGQVQLLEEAIGRPLFRKKGRKLELTETGELVYSYARDIFHLGSELEELLRQPRGVQRPVELRVGIVDAVPKLVAGQLMTPAMVGAQPFRVICREGKIESLLADLSVHRLELVLSDRPMPPALSVSAYTHRLGGSHVGFYAANQLAATFDRPFPQLLDGAPLLSPGSESAMGLRLRQWLGKHKLRPRVVGEFDDSAMVKSLGMQGLGVFIAPRVLDASVCRQYDATCLGEATDLIEEFHVITEERRITHPGVAAITEAARQGLFADWGR